MRDESKYITRLEQHEVKPTALRILLLRTMMAHDDAFSLQSLEDELDTVDKSTIYRTITLFLTHHLIHAIDDGTGMLKCGRTFCLQTTQVPLVSLPGNFQIHSINYVLKGLCPDCVSNNK